MLFAFANSTAVATVAERRSPWLAATSAPGLGVAAPALPQADAKKTGSEKTHEQRSCGDDAAQRTYSSAASS
jgi:hypothetical protein